MTTMHGDFENQDIDFSEKLWPVGLILGRNLHCGENRQIAILEGLEDSELEGVTKGLYYIQCACGHGFRTSGHKHIEDAVREYEAARRYQWKIDHPEDKKIKMFAADGVEIE